MEAMSGIKPLQPLTLPQVAYLVRKKDPAAWKRMTPAERQAFVDNLNAERERQLQLVDERWTLVSDKLFKARQQQRGGT
jgi:predicted Fe-S protein YdhL (DUF1289 family)